MSEERNSFKLDKNNSLHNVWTFAVWQFCDDGIPGIDGGSRIIGCEGPREKSDSDSFFACF